MWRMLVQGYCRTNTYHLAHSTAPTSLSLKPTHLRRQVHKLCSTKGLGNISRAIHAPSSISSAYNQLSGKQLLVNNVSSKVICLTVKQHLQPIRLLRPVSISSGLWTVQLLRCRSAQRLICSSSSPQGSNQRSPRRSTGGSVPSNGYDPSLPRSTQSIGIGGDLEAVQELVKPTHQSLAHRSGHPEHSTAQATPANSNGVPQNGWSKPVASAVSRNGHQAPNNSTRTHTATGSGTSHALRATALESAHAAASQLDGTGEEELEEEYEELEEDSQPHSVAPARESKKQSTASMTDAERAEMLQDVLEEQGVWFEDGFPASPGQHNSLLCPFCRGGDKGERMFSIFINEGYTGAAWTCFRANKCGQKGGTQLPTYVIVEVAPVDVAPKPPTTKQSAALSSPQAQQPVVLPVPQGATSSAAATPQPPPRTRSHAAAAQQEYYSASALEHQLRNLKPLTAEQRAWLETERCIAPEVIDMNGIMSTHAYCPALEKHTDAIVFPYYKGGEVVNMKFRALPKHFWQTRGGEKVLFGMDMVRDRGMVGEPPTLPWLIIVEGEMDVLALQTAGFYNVVSVPEGGVPPPKAGQPPRRTDGHEGKFAFLTNCADFLEMAERIVIATDNDGPGRALGEELARRLGKERCWRVMWPNNRDELLRDDIMELKAQEEGELQGGDPETEQEALRASDDTIVRPSSELFSEAKRLYQVSQPRGMRSAGDNVNAPAAGVGPAAVDGKAEGEVGTAAWVAAVPGDIPLGSAPSPPLADDDTGFRKDANEVLTKDGPEVLIRHIEQRVEWPVEGLFRFSDYYDDIHSYYDGTNPFNTGVTTGWPSMDDYYRVVPGELTVVTGVPNSGKSEWLDALAANLAEQHGWRFAFCSMEKAVRDHARQLLEKKVGKPFFGMLAYAKDHKRAEWSDIEAEFDWLDNHFFLIRREDDMLPNIDWVLEMAKMAVVRYGIRGLVIDPYNELDHQRGEMKETEYVSQMLTKVKRFAQHYEVHVWFVAHPRQMRDWKGEPPNLYDISGSAHFINKADNGIVVHRQWPGPAQREGGPGRQFGEKTVDPAEVRILVRKVRNKAAGKVGDWSLHYDRSCGRYTDPAGEQNLAGSRPPGKVLDRLAGGGVCLVDRDPEGTAGTGAATGGPAVPTYIPPQQLPGSATAGAGSSSLQGSQPWQQQQQQYPSPLITSEYGMEGGGRGRMVGDGEEEEEVWVQEEEMYHDPEDFKHAVETSR